MRAVLQRVSSAERPTYKIAEQSDSATKRRGSHRVAVAAAIIVIFFAATRNSGAANPAAPLTGILAGRVLAGKTPIRDSKVTLRETSIPKPFAETRTDADGRFTFDLSKARAKVLSGSLSTGFREVEQPLMPGSLYIVANGGDAGGGDNPAIKLTTLLGNPPAQGRVTINELTTVVAGFLQVLSGDDEFALARQLVDPVTGRLRPIFSRGVNSSALVNTLADILNSCVTSKGPAFAECKSLLQATIPPDWTATPKDTLTAATFLSRGEVAFSLLPARPPYVPVLNQPPPGWFLALNFANLGLHRPTSILSDNSNDTLWILNAGDSTLTELSTAPQDLTNPLLGTRKLPQPVRNQPTDFWFPVSVLGSPGKLRPSTPGWFAEPSAWLADGKLVFLDPDGNQCGSPPDDLGLRNATGLSRCGLFHGGICIANTDANEIIVVKQPDNLCRNAALLGRLKEPSENLSRNSVLAKPAHVVGCIRDNSDQWVTNSADNSVGAMRYFMCATALPGSPFHGGGLAEPEGVTCDNGGNVWVVNHAPNANSVTKLTRPTSPPIPARWPRLPCLSGPGDDEAYDVHVKAASPAAGFSAPGMKRPYGVAVDRLGNVWVTNEANDSVTVLISAGW